MFGSAGKRVVQTAMSLCMVNACIVWFVVLGNILPRLAAEYGFIEAETPAARQYILVGIATFVVFPISLLKNVMGAIAILSQISMGFYTMFALWVISLGGSAFVEMRWVKHVVRISTSFRRFAARFWSIFVSFWTICRLKFRSNLGSHGGSGAVSVTVCRSSRQR